MLTVEWWGESVCVLVPTLPVWQACSGGTSTRPHLVGRVDGHREGGPQVTLGQLEDGAGHAHCGSVGAQAQGVAHCTWACLQGASRCAWVSSQRRHPGSGGV